MWLTIKCHKMLHSNRTGTQNESSICNVNHINTLWQIDTMERDPRRKNIRLGFFLHSFSPQIYSIIFDITVRKLSLIYSAHFLSNCWCIWLKLMNSMTWLGNHFSSNAIHISRVICNSVRQTGPKFEKKSIWLPYFIAFWFCIKNELSGRCVLT